MNIDQSDCKGLTIDNGWVHFEARFGGKSEDIWIPVGHVVSIFARENSNGMGFEVEAYEPDEAEAATTEAESVLHMVKAEESQANKQDEDDDKTPPPEGSKSFLKIVK